MNNGVVNGRVSATFVLTNNVSPVDFPMTQTLGQKCAIPAFRTLHGVDLHM